MTLQLIRNLRFFGFAAVLTTAGLDTTAQPLLVVDRDVLRAAMVEELDEGYDPTATTNSARFFAEVIFSLAKTARTNDPRGRPLLIQQEDWFHIFHEVNGVPEENAGVERGLRSNTSRTC